MLGYRGRMMDIDYLKTALYERFHEMYMYDNPCYGHKNRRYELKLIKAGEQNG